ncbi:hypothetical protein HYALB_00002329 [Hymenoscyphus albidus]|uniref:Uncharacterized protein n=1 Tax=Hymenoscyphus albidus TaxID=595503 RepID=A0A9N9QCI6_9HELO|nr:hypothetical protein HYALB_00002329 [Hymenoscyphus albidus]
MAKSKKPKPTGFEEFYADPPITPAEYEEETENQYHSERPFHDRVQTAIQRYRARRKLDEKRANIFTKYLLLGGVDATPKAFTGGALDEETLANATAEEIAAVQAIDFIRPGGDDAVNAKFYDPTQEGKWVVDFEGIVKAFFSCTVPQRIGIHDDEMVKLACKVIKNFLDYLLQHEVCPEYTEEIMTARKVCPLAEKELTAIRKLGTLMPGKFNMALSTLFGGQFQSFAVLDAATWDDGDDGRDFALDEKTAKEIFVEGARFLSSRGISFNSLSTIVSVEQRTFQVVKSDASSGDLLVPIVCKPWKGPGLDEFDMPEPMPKGEQTFWLEPEIVVLLYVGMKLEVALCELDNGYKFFDMAGIFCSFYTFMENEKMQDWREPVLSTRPGPTEDDPDAEEAMLEGDEEGDAD